MFVVNSPQLLVKFTIPQLMNVDVQFVQIMAGIKKPGFYLSPQLIDAIGTQNWTPQFDKYKSDVFSLGKPFASSAARAAKLRQPRFLSPLPRQPSNQTSASKLTSKQAQSKQANKRKANKLTRTAKKCCAPWRANRPLPNFIRIGSRPPQRRHGHARDCPHEADGRVLRLQQLPDKLGQGEFVPGVAEAEVRRTNLRTDLADAVQGGAAEVQLLGIGSDVQHPT